MEIIQYIEYPECRFLHHYAANGKKPFADFFDNLKCKEAIKQDLCYTDWRESEDNRYLITNNYDV